jgi:hypothetical protein
LAKTGSKEIFMRRRAVEGNHGRVSLCARVGDFVPKSTKHGGYLSPPMGIRLSDTPNGLDARGSRSLAGS